MCQEKIVHITTDHISRPHQLTHPIPHIAKTITTVNKSFMVFFSFLPNIQDMDKFI